jgi:hypothetical protein
MKHDNVAGLGIGGSVRKRVDLDPLRDLQSRLHGTRGDSVRSLTGGGATAASDQQRGDDAGTRYLAICN